MRQVDQSFKLRRSLSLTHTHTHSLHSHSERLDNSKTRKLENSTFRPPLQCTLFTYTVPFLTFMCTYTTVSYSMSLRHSHSMQPNKITSKPKTGPHSLSFSQ